MDNLLPAGASTGEPLSRVDGRLKETSQARYAAVHAVPGCVHGVLVCSAVARGRINRLDHRYGRLRNHYLAEYHVPVHTDVPEITVEFIDQPEPGARPHRGQGVGKIGLVSFAAAVANAVPRHRPARARAAHYAR
jgi:CO/xanthine dehydrogenase Mo-binding subunit